MNFYYYFTEFFIFFGSGLCFFLTILELLKKDKTETSKSLLFLGFFFGSVQLRLGFVISKTLEEFPILHFGLIPSILAVGPIVLFIAFSITDFIDRKKVHLIYHFIPFVISFIYEVYFLNLSSEVKSELIKNTLYNDGLSLQKGIFLICILHILTYFAYLIFLFRKINMEYKIEYSKFVWIILFVPSAGIILISNGLFFHNFHLFRLGASVLTITVMLVYIFYTIYPKFFVTLKADIQQKKYETTYLSEINIEEIKLKLNLLIVDKKIYLDEELRLNGLAEELNINSHQLSRILNETYGKNFNEFINFYRIELAKQILLEDKKRSIISISHEVGFNSKATFNTQFLKIVGMTPSQHRKKNV